MLVYLAADGFTDDLVKELPDVERVAGRIVLAGGAVRAPLWAANVWLEPELKPVESIGQVVRHLKSLQRNWAFFASDWHRRHALIQEQLPPVKSAPLDFLGPVPSAPLGSWTLLERDLLLLSAKCSSPFANGEVHFNENKTDPPSRAYLKLWEVFTTCGFRPSPGDRCIDLGSSPGGWTWVLQKLGCSVISVDKAPLAESVSRLPKVEYLCESAFGLTPEKVGPVDWVFSDVICYPDRLLRLVRQWLDSGLAKNFICTVKLQGETDRALIEEFRNIRGSQLLHLYCNKHELTWINLAEHRTKA